MRVTLNFFSVSSLVYGALLLFAEACGEPCVPGRSVACACADGREGAQQCLSSHEFADCSCLGSAGTVIDGPGQTPGQMPGQTPGQSSPSQSIPGQATLGPPARDGSVSVGGAVDGGRPKLPVTDAAPPKLPTTTDAAPPSSVASGPAQFVDMFAVGADLWVADSQGVSHLSLLDGHSIARWTAPRPLTAAAFDGAHLVALDGAKLTTLERADLTVLVEGTLIEACADAVLLSDNQLVCGPANDWDRVFYTYDALTGSLLASSAKNTYHGIPMRRVPGMDAFVTVTTALSPSDFYLYKVGPDHAAVFVNESPYHGDFSATDVYAFDGTPPSHLVTNQGLLLRFDLACSPANAPSQGTVDQCFVKDGAVGTLTGSQTFIAMDSTGPVLTALIDTRGNGIPSDTAAANYLVQTIDLPSRTVLTQQVVNLPSGGVLGFRSSVDQKKVVLAVGTGPSQSSFDPPTGYDVLRFDLP